MQYRNMAKSTSQSPFSNWLNNKSNNTPELASIDADQDDDESESFSLLGQVQSIQDSFTSQLQELSGSLPDAGPLSAGFRKRIKYSIYLLFGAAIFAALAIVIGIPTIVLRPSKFVICITLSTILAASSVIVMQKPSVFFGNLLKGGPVKAAPMIVLILTSLLTIYLTIFVHKYLVVIAAAGIQVLAVMWYLSSFIPGGQRGLYLLVKTSYIILGTVLKPAIFVCKKTMNTIISQLNS